MPSLSHLHHTLWNTWAHSGTLVHCHNNLHIVTLDNTVAQMHTSLHTTSKLHTLWNTRGHRRHLRRLETLNDTRKLEDTRNTWGHRRRLKTLKDTIAKKFCTPQTTLHGLVRKHCILVSLKTEIRTQKTLYPCITLKTLYPYIHVSLWTENRKHCITLKLYPLFFWSRIILYHWTPFYTTSLYSIVLDCVATFMKW